MFCRTDHHLIGRLAVHRYMEIHYGIAGACEDAGDIAHQLTVFVLLRLGQNSRAYDGGVVWETALAFSVRVFAPPQHRRMQLAFVVALGAVPPTLLDFQLQPP